MWQQILVGAIVFLAAAFAGYRLFYRKNCGCSGCKGCAGKTSTQSAPHRAVEKDGPSCGCPR